MSTRQGARRTMGRKLSGAIRRTQKIIIPRSCIRPNQSAVIEIPEHLQNSEVVVVTPPTENFLQKWRRKRRDPQFYRWRQNPNETMDWYAYRRDTIKQKQEHTPAPIYASTPNPDNPIGVMDPWRYRDLANNEADFEKMELSRIEGNLVKFQFFRRQLFDDAVEFTKVVDLGSFQDDDSVMNELMTSAYDSNQSAPSSDGSGYGLEPLLSIAEQYNTGDPHMIPGKIKDFIPRCQTPYPPLPRGQTAHPALSDY